MTQKNGRLRAPPGFGDIVQRRAQDDAAIDGADLKLERVALPVLLRPNRKTEQAGSPGSLPTSRENAVY